MCVVNYSILKFQLIKYSIFITLAKYFCHFLINTNIYIFSISNKWQSNDQNNDFDSTSKIMM